jgi:4-hydroxy-tetrahydrodipicolinate synthase
VGAVARIAAATSLPVMVQDAPAYLGTGLGVDGLLAVLDGGPNVCALKVEGGSEPIAALRRRSLGIPLWAGDGGRHLLDAFRAGAIGAIPGVEVVDRLVAVAELEAAGAGSLADDLFTSLLPLLVFELESLARYAASAKHVLVRRGLLELAATRLAGASLDPTSRRLLDLHLERALAPVPPNARSFS